VLLLYPGSARTDGPISALDGSLAVETFDLELVEFDKETADEVLKDIAAVVDQLSCLFVCQDLLYVLLWLFKIWEQKDEYFCLVARYLHQVNLTVDLVEVTVLNPS
jgi:hypothetical protein